MEVGLLRRFLQLYWLKPFDAVNDTANAVALRGFEWRPPILEIGGGDGAFSFTMHGGAFAFAADRYDQADPARGGDMFDTDPLYALPRTRAAQLAYAVGVDLKWSHLQKARHTGLYEHLVQSRPGPLPFRDGAFRTVFLYFPHGLVERGERLDYDAALREIRRVLRPDGELFMTAFESGVTAHFLCARASRQAAGRGWTRVAAYLDRLDGGRAAEIGSLARPADDWPRLLRCHGFKAVEQWSHVSPFLWRLYDIQSRPILRPLTRANRLLARWFLKGPVKALAVAVLLPVLAALYRAGGRPRRFEPGSKPGVLLIFRALRACES